MSNTDDINDIVSLGMIRDEQALRIEELEAKLEMAVDSITTIMMRATPHKDDDDKDRKRQLIHIHSRAISAIAELKGDSDD